MEILLGLAGATGLAALLQSKALPSQEDAEKALAKIEKVPLDPDANTVLGKYKAFVMGDYVGAMPYLVHSKDATLKTLAEHELDQARTDTPEKQVAMGDEWVLAAKKFPILSRQFYDRASEWYVKAWPLLPDPWKAKVREQGKKLAASRPPGPVRKAFPSGWEQSAAALMDGTVAHSGSYSAKLPEKDPKNPPPEIRFASDPIPVTGKKVFELNAYALSDLTENPMDTFYVHIFNANGTGVGTWATLIPTDVPLWRKFTIRKDIPEHIVFVKLGAVKYSKSGVIWADDFSVKLDGVEVLKNGSFEQK